LLPLLALFEYELAVEELLDGALCGCPSEQVLDGLGPGALPLPVELETGDG
jgi:hypothetical protein